VNPDFKDLLQALNGNGVRYLIIGGYAVIKHAEPRFTKDLIKNKLAVGRLQDHLDIEKLRETEDKNDEN